MQSKTNTIFAFFISMSLPYTVYADNESLYQQAITRTALHETRCKEQPLAIIQGPTVRMVVFTTYGGYKTTDTRAGATIWVTVAPEIKEKCTDYINEQSSPPSAKQVSLWLVQLLGLSPRHVKKRRFVEIEVPVIQAYYGSTLSDIGIFRPCTDPRIGPHEDKSPICPRKMNPKDTNISSDYKTWFINNSISSHSHNNGAPWVKYGCTYNWNNQANNSFGVSEFVVLKNTPITVLPNPMNSNTPYLTVAEYCNEKR